MYDNADVIPDPPLVFHVLKAPSSYSRQNQLQNLEAPSTSSHPMSRPSHLLESPEGLVRTHRPAERPEFCGEHGENPSTFCLDALEPLCKRCGSEIHRGHRVYPLTEAATDCKEELKQSLKGLQVRMSHFEEVTQTCRDASRHNQAEAKLTEEHLRREFESLHQFLRDEEEARLLVVRQKQEQKKREAREQIDTFNRAIKSLETKIQLMEEELQAGGDGKEFLKRHTDATNSTCAGVQEPQMFRGPLFDVAKHLGNLQYAVWEKMKEVAPYTSVTLDPRTAGVSLRVSPELTGVHIAGPGPSRGLEQSLRVAPPANPERFRPYSAVVAREGFDSGAHSWDIEVGDTKNWTVGLAAQSLPRGTDFDACPEAGLWCISLRDGEYLALTSPSQSLDHRSSRRLARIRVRLDWDKGTLSFMNADAGTHLFTFQNSFSEKVFPYFESIAACGGLEVPPQSVKISLGSERVSVEDEAIGR